MYLWRNIFKNFSTVFVPLYVNFYHLVVLEHKVFKKLKTTCMMLNVVLVSKGIYEDLLHTGFEDLEELLLSTHIMFSQMSSILLWVLSFMDHSTHTPLDDFFKLSHASQGKVDTRWENKFPLLEIGFPYKPFLYL